ncbi:MAG: heat-inducible transcriptional repressor HrcA [Christensenellaceae bacterium]|jgi:heat-inducible transcriptional repressor|nr:heat-inducible transcriptional repressor HrcA [Christensenellaceae bacterium]
MLSTRKQTILKAVVDEYIKGALPISSGEIKNKYFDDVSAATIRTELSTLEDMGYLVQPHTSAGRIPSPLAYRFYVDNFLRDKTLKIEEIETINASFNNKFLRVEEIVKTAAKVISDMTNYTSVIVLKNINKVYIKGIKIIGLDDKSALVVIITDSGIIRDKVILVDAQDESFLADATVLINKIFAGRSLGDIKSKAASARVDAELNTFRELLNSIMNIILSYEDETNSVITEGEKKVLDYPETSLESARNFFSLIDDKKSISALICDNADIEFSLKIGKSETNGIDKCAVVTARYSINGKEIGHAGVIGPERMDYSKVISVLSYVGNTINSIMENTDDADLNKDEPEV